MGVLFVNTTDKPAYYANIANCNFNNYDFTFMLGQKKNREDGQILSEDIDLSITMSPQHAKAFALMLYGQLQQYEELFGEIKLEPIVDKTQLKE